MGLKPSERALKLFAQNCNCAQSVYAALATEPQLTQAQRLAVAAPFGGGVAGQGDICGALTGALLAVGEMHSTAMAANPAAARDAVNRQAGKMIAEFRAAHGSILCRELTGCLLCTEEGKRSFKERNVRAGKCTKLVAFAADLAAQQN